MSLVQRLRNDRIINVVLVVAVALVAWDLAVRVFAIRPFLLPAPATVLGAIASDPVFYATQASYTLSATLLGFGLAIVIAFLAALGAITSRTIEMIVFTGFVTMNAIPKIALAPLFIIWLGTDLAPKVAIAFLVAVFPIVIATVAGFRSIEPDLVKLARSLQASRSQMLWRFRLPTALPSIFSGMKIGISAAFIGAIVGEFIASQAGLGYVIVSSQATFDTVRMFAAVLLLAALGLFLFYLLDFIERISLPWHVSQR